MEKIGSRLSAALAQNQGTDDAGYIDVVVELARTEPPRVGEVTPVITQDLLREQFRKAVEPVRALTRAAGGEVSAEAWINQTVRAKVPVSCIDSLARLDEVRLVDLPSGIAAE